MTPMQHARKMYAEMLISLRKMLEAEQTYARLVAQHEDKIRDRYRYAPGEKLSEIHAKLAEQNADRDPLATETLNRIRLHTPRATALGVAYLVSVYHERFGTPPGNVDDL